MTLLARARRGPGEGVDEVGPESCPAGRSSLHDGCLGESEFFDVLECVLVLREVDERVGNAKVFKECHGVGHIVMFSICVDRYVFAHDVLFLSTNNFFCLLAREIDSDRECRGAGLWNTASAARICRESPERRRGGSYDDRPER